ncbi:MAG: hypothetical protein KF715_19875 [Candidatus Didemnitutus sp.]|nr:hypothetical protein [Candidatus Didemnitutus sp.]
MRTVRSPAYARPDPECFSAGPWRALHGRSLSDGEPIRDWDPSLALQCTREIEIDLVRLSRSGGLKPGAFVSLLPTWWSEETSLRGCGAAHHIQVGASGGRQRFTLEITVPAEEIAGSLQLRSVLVLAAASPAMERDRLAPRRPGSVLWEDSISVLLEGDAPRFPMSVVDFVTDAVGPASACWCLEFSPPDPTLPAMAALRLLVNSRHEIFRQALVSTAPTEAQLAIRSGLKHAVAVEMVNLALCHARDLELGPHEAGTAGRVLADLLARVFPGESPVALQEKMKTEPAKLAMAIQAAMGLYSPQAMRGGDQ